MWVVRWHELDSFEKYKTKMLFTNDIKVAELFKSLIEKFGNTESKDNKVSGFVSISRIFFLENNSFETDKLHFCQTCNENSKTIKVNYETDINYLWHDKSNCYLAEEAKADYDNGASIICNKCGHDIYKKGEIEYKQLETLKSGIAFKTDKLKFCTYCNTDARSINITVPTETVFIWDEKHKCYITSDTIDDNDNLKSCTCTNCGRGLN